MADEKSCKLTKKITVTGIVQGVGFRPFVYRLATRYGLSGYVRNAFGSVEIAVTGTPADIEAFMHELTSNPPKLARLDGITVCDSADMLDSSFTVCESGGDVTIGRFFSPDIAICEECRREIFDPRDRRYGHPFNNCVNCGPRFSALTAFPYDRKNTSMSEFKLCPQCGAEYREPADRRFHAETTSCHNCGPSLFYRGENGICLKDAAALAEAVAALKRGGIVAVKGIGGYHLACLASDNEAVRLLRTQKGREEKPFAVMFRDIAEIKAVCAVSDADSSLLHSGAHPIVLLPLHDRTFAPEAIRGSNRCGCFLPYTPLQALLMAQLSPLVMTSANVSSDPIATDDSEALARWAHVLYHNREILRSVEDSVVQTVCGKTQLIRRARGYVPLPLKSGAPSDKRILAMGGDLKAVFALTLQESVIMSQFFGDLENAAVTNRYLNSIDDFIRLFDISPEIIVCDSHPAYFSHHMAKHLAERFCVPCVAVSHHHAHIASVMAEHQLCGKVIGVAFDGSGYGDDGNIWGGEFLLCEGASCRRTAHLDYTTLLGADAAAKDARETAACFFHQNGLPFSHPDKDVILAALTHRINSFFSSSMGRLFDAVASITGVCHENSCEGRCASMLQALAENARDSGTSPTPMSFDAHEADGMLLIGQRGILEKACEAADAQSFALGFHIAIADMVRDVCQRIRQKESVNQVALSGGVFQNTLLLSLCVKSLTDAGFAVCFNTEVPPNDGGLALGQSCIAARKISTESR